VTTQGQRLSAAVRRLHLPERADQLGMSVREADRYVAASLGPEVLDTTHFDTVRFPPPPWAAETFAAAAADGRHAYTPYRGAALVRGSVAAELTTRLEVEVDPERHLLLSPGTQEGLFAVLAALVSPGDTVALFDPDYLYSERILRLLGATVHPVPLVDSDQGQVPDLDELSAALRAGASVVLFSHPNNPTGALYPAEILTGIADLVRHHGAFAVVDELYARLVYDGQFPHLITEPGMRSAVPLSPAPRKPNP
jgi:aspartate/methionine/tyrosine aminotransferase